MSVTVLLTKSVSYLGKEKCMEILKDVHDTLFQNLNPNILSMDSVRSIIFLLLGFGISVFCIRTLKNAVQWWIGLILFIEIMHVIAFQTPVGEYAPIIQVIFKYDTLSMIAQLCVGTKVCDGILYVRAFLEAVIGTAVTCIWNWFWLLIDYLKHFTPFMS